MRRYWRRLTVCYVIKLVCYWFFKNNFSYKEKWLEMGKRDGLGFYCYSPEIMVGSTLAKLVKIEVGEIKRFRNLHWADVPVSVCFQGQEMSLDFPLSEKPPVSWLDPTFTRYFCLPLWLAIDSWSLVWAASLLLSWPERLLSRHSPQTATQGMINITLMLEAVSISIQAGP